MINTYWKKLLLAVVCLLPGFISANAQFKATLEQYARSNYSTDAVVFSLTEIATQLETDTTSLMDGLRAWSAGNSADGNMFFYQEPDGNFTDNYTQGGKGGYWINMDGTVGDWPNAVYYNTIGWDSENDQFAISFGQFPDSLSAGATFTPHFKLVFNGKEATFDITYIVNPIPEVSAPTTLKESELNVVDEVTLEIHQFPRSGTNASSYDFEIAGLLEKLGVPSDEVMGAILPNILYTTQRDPVIGAKKDSVTNESTASAPGWWYAKQTEDETGTLSKEVVSAPYGTDGEVYYVEGFSFNENTLSFNLGQHGNALAVGDEYYNVVYLIYNDKAYRIRINLTIDQPDYNGLDDMTMTGETIIEKSQGIDDAYSYQAVNFTLDTDAIAEELGCEKSQLSLQVLDNNNNLTSAGTANNGGFWMTADGVACAWGASAIVFVEPVTAGDLSTLKIGHYPGNMKPGDEVRFNMYIVNEGKYHKLDILYKVTDKEAEDQSGYTVVATRNAVVQVISSSTDYIVSGNQTVYTLTTATVNELIGTSSPELYCELADSITAKTGEKYAHYSDYLCDPAPGVWLGKQGQGHKWTGNSEAPVGICYAPSTGNFTIYQAPGANPVGSAYKTNLYLVNEETKDMVKVSFTIQFVSELVEINIVGEEDVTLPVDLNGQNVDIDLSKAATALEVTVDELVSGYNLSALTSTGLYSEGVDPINSGCQFDHNTGYYDEMGAIHIFFVEGGEYGYQIQVFGDEEVDYGYKKEGEMCFQFDTKRYIYHLTFIDPETYDEYITGIKDISVKKNSNDRVFDLSGRMVKQPSKGLYILQGKKYVVK